MRVFIVFCLVAVASANQLGYNYQPVAHASDNAPSYDAGSHDGADYATGSNSASDNVPSYAGSQDDAEYAAGSNSAPSYSGPQGGVAEGSHDAPSYSPQADIDKEFYTFNANEEDFNDGEASNQLTNSVKQGLRVVFIKGPENRGLEDAALGLAKHSANQKTDIYVLNKQADLAGLSDKLNTANTNNNNKPEVHFVKYRTPEDAANAQKAIQGQYDSLGGPSQSHNGGVAPVLDFASKAPVASHGSHGAASAPSSSYVPAASSVAASYPSPSYLPASIFRRLRL